MKIKNIISWVVLIISIMAFVLGMAKAFSGEALAASGKTRTYTGHVNFIHKNKIVIDDFEMELATGIGHIRKGSYVQFTFDEQGRIIKIKKAASQPSKTRKANHKAKKKRGYKSNPKKPITKPNPAKTGPKIKKRNGVWRNY